MAGGDPLNPSAVGGDLLDRKVKPPEASCEFTRLYLSIHWFIRAARDLKSARCRLTDGIVQFAKLCKQRIRIGGISGLQTAAQGLDGAEIAPQARVDTGAHERRVGPKILQCAQHIRAPLPCDSHELRCREARVISNFNQHLIRRGFLALPRGNRIPVDCCLGFNNRRRQIRSGRIRIETNAKP